MKRYILFILILFDINFNQPVSSQVKPIITFTEEDGLASNNVKDIIRDRNGILWIATDNGLSKYDGEKFQNIYKADGLPSNKVWSLAVDTSNTIYAACFQDGLAIIRNNSVVKILHTTGKYPNSFRKLYYSNYYKKLLVGTDYGLYILKDTILLPIKYEKDTAYKSQVLSFTENKSRIFFSSLGGNQGMYEVFINSSQLEKSYAKRIAKMGRFASVVLNDTLYSSNYNIIFKNPLSNLERQSSNSMVDSSFFIWNMTPYGATEIMMGGLGEGRFNGGIRVYNTLTKESFIDTRLTDKQTVNKILYDSTSRVTWFCKEGGLVCELNSPFEYYYSKSIGSILDIGFAGDSLLVLAGDKVFYFDGRNFIPIITKQLIFSRVSSELKKVEKLYNDKSVVRFEPSSLIDMSSFTKDENRLFVNTAKGFLSVPSLTQYFPVGLGTFKFTKDGGLFALTTNIPLLHYPSFKNLKKFKFYSNAKSIFKIIESNGVYYFATSFNGLYAIKDSVLTKIDETNSGLDKHLTDIDKDVNGSIWCCSANGNFFEIGFSDSLFIKRTLNSSNCGLVGNNCKWLKFNSNHLFVATNKGLNIISIANLYSSNPNVEHFYNQYNGYEYISATSPVVDKNGNLFVHTNDKIIKVNHDFSADTPLNINISNIKINGVEVDLSMIDGKKLPFSQKQISFNFSAAKYPTTKNLSYKYRINKDEWTDGNLVTLQSLRSGYYSVVMEVFNRENNSNHTRTLEFLIKRPFWLTWWFILFSISIITVVFIQVMRIRVSRLRKQHEEKSALITQNSELRLRSLQIQMNPHFIFNALNSVQGYIINKNTQSALVYIGNIASIIRSNLENASNEYIHLTEEIEFLKKYAQIEMNRFKDVLQIDFINNVSDCNILVPPMLIQPIIENAVKHGIRGLKKNGQITVTFSTKEETLTVIVEDNGVGRDHARQFNKYEHNGMGMQIIRERLTLLNVKYHNDFHQLQIFDLIENGSPLGTRVLITLKLVKATNFFTEKDRQ